MEATVDSFRRRLQSPWLVEDQGDFMAQFEQDISCIQNLDTPEIIESTDATIYLVRIFAALALGKPAFLVNPGWQQQEREQFTALDLSQAPLGHLMIPTGGTGGTVKFVMHNWQTLTAAAEGYACFYDTAVVNAWCTLPLHHVSGLMQAVRSFVTGGQLLLADYRDLDAHHEMDRSTFHLSLVPTQLRRILEQKGGVDWLRGFGLILIGGAGMPEDLATHARDEQLPLSPSYGMTETAAVVAAQKPTDFMAGHRLAGELLPHAHASITDGEVILHGQSLFRGYYPATPAPCARFATGDDGELDSEGHLLVHGRRDRFINTGGEKVDPRLVETAICQLYPQAEVLVVGQPDADWGERVMAILSGFNQDDLPRLQQQLRAVLQRHMLPRSWLVTDHLPLRPNGKVDTYALARCLNEA
ncbi:MAG: AMP-binding protein [Verrucomicrobiota bacterium]